MRVGLFALMFVGCQLHDDAASTADTMPAVSVTASATALAPIDPPVASTAEPPPSTTASAKRSVNGDRQAALLEQSNEMNRKMLDMLGGGPMVSRDAGSARELRLGTGTGIITTRDH